MLCGPVAFSLQMLNEIVLRVAPDHFGGRFHIDPSQHHSTSLEADPFLYIFPMMLRHLLQQAVRQTLTIGLPAKTCPYCPEDILVLVDIAPDRWIRGNAIAVEYSARRNNLTDDVSMYVCQTIVTSLKAIGQSRVIDAQ